MQSELERAFLTRWRQLNGPELKPEYKFHHSRKWRFDFAIPDKLIAIECEGATWTGGRHTRGAGFAKDCEKYNAAALLGWRVFRLTTDMISDAPMQNIMPIIELAES